ncbi:hypothetical protein [Luteimonas sp. 3794]|uniref:hypothetical protein n=1 Tax=Luteimonas sp. 3794 TaxID=2817730 RepID=UPI00285B097E|nr:hypothetical protein [Luteimonas sp. 3794]MDR6991735.1 hypothetical protein [Luteimonas sp. 3794]
MRQMMTIAAWPLTGAGLGLLMWSGMTTALLQLRPGPPSTLHQLQLLGLLLGVALVAAGSLARRFDSQLASPGTRRTRMLRLMTLVIAALLLGLLLAGVWATRGALLAGLGLLLSLAAFTTVAATAAGYSAPEAPAPWRHPLVLPVHLLFAMSTGLALLYALMDRLFVSANDGRTMLATLTGLGACLALCKALYWRAVHQMPAAVAPSRVFHGARATVLGLAAGVPLLCWLLAMTHALPTLVPLLLAAAALLGAAALEHRLFLHEGDTRQAQADPGF